MSHLNDRDFWNTAAQYARVAQPFTAAFARRALDEAKLPPHARVLDVACGPGALALMAVEAGASVLATDFSQNMIDQVRAIDHLAIEARVMDGQALDLPDESFDATFSIFGIVLFADWRAGLSELARVTRSGGTGAIATWPDPHGAAINLAVGRMAERIAPEIAHPPLLPGIAATRTPALLTAAMQDGGFHAVRVLEHSHPFVMPAADLASDAPFAFSPVWPLLTPDQQAQVRAELWNGAIDREVRVPSTALIAIGYKA